MKVKELKTLISLRKSASSVLVKNLPWIDIELDGKNLQPTGECAKNIATGIMVAVQAMEISAGIS